MKAIRTAVWRHTIVFAVLVTALAVAGGIVAANARLAKLQRVARSEWYGRLAASVSPTQGFLSAWIDDRFADAREAAVAVGILPHAALRSQAAIDSVAQTVAGRTRRAGFIGVWMIDTTGAVVGSDGKTTPRASEIAAARHAALKFTELVTGPAVDRMGGARVAIVTPIPAHRLGLLLVYDAGQTLFPLIAREGGAEHTIRTKLIAADSDGIHVLSPSVYPASEALGRVVVQAQAPRAWQLAVSGVDTVGTFANLDRRQMIAATTSVTLAKWGVVREIDEDEALGPARDRFHAECVVVLSLLVVCITACAAVYRDARKRERVEALDRRIRATRDEAQRIHELHDAMERTVAERTADLRTALHAAETANRTKSEFLARMSHELRTPLNSIIGFTNALLKNKAGNLRVQDLNYLERVGENGKNLLAHINSILDLAKIESGRMEIEQTEVDVSALATDVVHQLEGVLRDRPVTLHTEVPACPAVQWSDEAKLRQILVNLVGNAAKFTDEGEVTVRVVADAQTRRATRVEVRDTGIGIPADRLKTIFKPFEQGDNTMTRRYGGTGLGLAITCSLCELLGAQLTVESAVGMGSAFVVHFGGTEAR